MGVIGETLGRRYVIERLLASGRFSSVYVARDMTSGATRAVQLVRRPTSGHPDASRRLLTRMRLALRTIHAVILPIMDSGCTGDESLYLVMELLEGHTLEGELETSGSPSIPRYLEIISNVLKGLAVAHG